MPFLAPSPPVSYSRQIAPVLALHCYGCHGDSGGLNIRTYADLMRGGNLGKVIVPGDPERSLLIHFLEGRRGESHRMPRGGRRFSPALIQTFRRWIAAGAKMDAVANRSYTRTLRKVRMIRGKTLVIYCRVNTNALLVLNLRDPHTGRTLYNDMASIKSPKERVDAGEPGQPISWSLRPEPGWPEFVTVELTIEYPARIPRDTQLYTRSP